MEALKKKYGSHEPREIFLKTRPVKAAFDISIRDLAIKYTRDLLLTSEIDKVDDFAGLHWGVEVGPWTIELQTRPKTHSKRKSAPYYMKSTHKDEMNDSWMNRHYVGTTTLPDKCFENPETVQYSPDQDYGIFGSNCQKAASEFALSISDTPVATFDEIFHWDQRSTTFLDLKDVLDSLKKQQGWSRRNEAFWPRYLVIEVRRYLVQEWMKLDEAAIQSEMKEIEASLSRLDWKIPLAVYFSIERAAFPGLKNHSVDMKMNWIDQKIRRGMHHANVRKAGRFLEDLPSDIFISK